MTLIAHFRRVCFPLFLVAAVLSSCPSFAITMDVSVGFGGATKTKVWTPVAVRLVNNSNEDIQGTIVIAQPNGSASLPGCTTAVKLPANSQKLYHSYVRVIGYSNEFDVSLIDGGNLLITKTVTANIASREDKLVVSVGDLAGRVAFLQGETMPVTISGGASAPLTYPGSSGSSGPTATVNTGLLVPSLLPDRPAAYEGVDVLVISDLDPSAVNPNSLKALSMWVASGGTVVISTGADYRRYVSDFYSELLPVTIEGAANISSATSMSALGKAQFPLAPAVVTKSSVKPGIGRVLAAEGGVPLVVERTYGVGKVVFLAFSYKDSPFRDWNGQVEFWKSILRAPGKSPMVPSITLSPEEYRQYSYSYGGAAPELGLVSLVAQNPQVKMPSFSTIGFFLLAYLIVLVPVNYIVLRRRRRLELAWVTIPVIVIAFTLGAYAIGYTMKGSDLKMRVAEVVEGSSGARYARAVSNASVFSPARRAYDVQVDDPTAISQVLAFSDNQANMPAHLDGDKTQISLDMAMWSSKSLEAVGGVDLGGALKSDLVLSGAHIKGTLTNGTSIAFKNCRISYRGADIAVPDLAPGASVNVDDQLARLYMSPNPAVAANQGNDVSVKLGGYVSGCASQAVEPILIAEASNDPSFTISGRHPSVDCSKLYAFHLNCRVGGSFDIPAAAMRWSMTDAVNAGQYGPAQSRSVARVEFYQPGQCAFVFQMPVPANCVVTELHLSAAGDQSGFKFFILNRQTGKSDPVQIGSGKTIKDAAKYIGQSNDVKVQVVCKHGSYRDMKVQLSARGVAQ